MSIKNKTALKAENDQVYDDAIALTQEVTATNQKRITNDQIDSLVPVKDREVNVDVSITPLTITLDFSSTEQFILDLTTQPGTKVFAVTIITGIVSGQSVHVRIIKNADQSITLDPAEGPPIIYGDNPLQLTGLGSSLSLFYSYFNDAVAIAANEATFEIYIDSVGGSDTNDGRTSATPFATENKAYDLAQTVVTASITIFRARDGVYTLTNPYVLLNKDLTFDDFGGGAANPDVRTSGASGQLTLTGTLRLISTDITTLNATVPYFLTSSLAVKFESGTLEVLSTIIMFKDANNGYPSKISFASNSSYIISGGLNPVTITDIGVQAIDVVGAPTIVNFLENIPSKVLNINDGLTPIFSCIFEGDDSLKTNTAINKLIELGPDAGKWTVSNAALNMDNVDTAELITQRAFGGPRSPRDIWLDQSLTRLYILTTVAPVGVSLWIITDGNIVSAAFQNTLDSSSEDTIPSSLHFSNDGLRLFIVGKSNNLVYGYSLSTAYDLTTAVHNVLDVFDPAAWDTLPEGIWFSPDGMKMVISGNNSTAIYQFDLTTAHVINAGVTLGSSFALGSASQMWPSGVHLSPDGLKMYVANAVSGRIEEYVLSIAFNVSTAKPATEIALSTAAPTSLAGVHLDDDGLRMYSRYQLNTTDLIQYNLNGDRSYNLKRLGAAVGTDSYDYTIDVKVEDENEANVVSGASIERDVAAGTLITVENGASKRKDFSVKVYKNT